MGKVKQTIDAAYNRIILLYGDSIYEKPRKERTEICKQALQFYLNEQNNNPL